MLEGNWTAFVFSTEIINFEMQPTSVTKQIISMHSLKFSRKGKIIKK